MVALELGSGVSPKVLCVDSLAPSWWHYWEVVALAGGSSHWGRVLDGCRGTLAPPPHMSPAMMRCLTQAQKQWSHGTLDQNL